MDIDNHKRPDKTQLYEQGFEIVKFRELPMSHQMAICWHMTVDGSAWSDVIDYDKHSMPDSADSSDAILDKAHKSILQQHMPDFLDRYGDLEFGVATWKTNALLETVASDEGFSDMGLDRTREHFQQTITGYHITAYSPVDRWPIIMSDEDYETIHDGWHRFQIYVSNGHTDIPVIFHPSEWHRDLKISLEASGPAL